MALTKIHRRRAPLDGSWFRTDASLQSILRATSGYDDEMSWPKFVEEVRVPVWISMRQYKAQETRANPTGMMYGPVVRVGAMDSPEVPMFGYHHAAGLFHDWCLDTSVGETKWMYRPFEYGDQLPPGEDVSIYRCSECGHDLYRDDLGLRPDKSACIKDGSLVCRDCDVDGLVYDFETKGQVERARRLATHVGGDAKAALERSLERLGEGFCFGRRSQTRLFRDGKFSFSFSVLVRTPEGVKRGLVGGLIQHGPCPIEDGDGFRFRTWDYTQSKERDATPEEVSYIHWNIHT